MRHPFVSASLRLGICIPFIYFGIQLLAIPFYPGFNILVNSASDLGTAHSLKPWIFNLGAIVTGLITLASVYGFYQSLRSSGTNILLTALVCFSLIRYGSSSIAAGLFPIPHPYHGAGPAQLGIILGPALFVAAFWKRRRESGWAFPEKPQQQDLRSSGLLFRLEHLPSLVRVSNWIATAFGR